MSDYSELERLAKAATPGPWQQHLVDDTTVTSTTLDVCCTFPDGGRNDDVDFAAPVEQHEANAAYIAAANPQVIISLIARVKELEEALTPSAETKAAYIGKFSVPLPDQDEDGNEVMRMINVPWTTIKEIMAAIKSRALSGKGV